jgi:hypothetical protein
MNTCVLEVGIKDFNDLHAVKEKVRLNQAVALFL